MFEKIKNIKLEEVAVAFFSGFLMAVAFMVFYAGKVVLETYVF